MAAPNCDQGSCHDEPERGYVAPYGVLAFCGRHAAAYEERTGATPIPRNAGATCPACGAHFITAEPVNPAARCASCARPSAGQVVPLVPDTEETKE